MPYHLYMKGICINFAVHSHRADAELFRGANHTTCNFSPRTQIRAGYDLDVSIHLFAMSILSKWGFRGGIWSGSVHALIHQPPITQDALDTYLKP